MSNISAMDDGGENNIRRAGGRTRSAQMAALGVVMPRCRLISAGHLRSGPEPAGRRIQYRAVAGGSALPHLAAQCPAAEI
jgi:hypothetical protein